MIYAEKENPSEEVFLELLENSKNGLVEKLQNDEPLPNSTQFEVLVCEVMQGRAVGTEFEGTIRQTGVAAFPDIVAKMIYYKTIFYSSFEDSERNSMSQKNH